MAGVPPGWQSARPRVRQSVRILSWLSSSAATTGIAHRMTQVQSAPNGALGPRSDPGKETDMTAIAPRMVVSTLRLTNSDIELERRIANFLHHRRVPGQERIRLVARGGVVTVSGRIPTRTAKWLCVECCRRVAGVLRVVDELTFEPNVVAQSAAVALRSEIENRRARQFDSPSACDYAPTVPFKPRQDRKRRRLAASSRPKLMTAA